MNQVRIATWAVIAVDVGNNTYSFGRYFRVQGRPTCVDVGLPRLDRLRIPGRDGRVGGCSRRPIVAVTGDGGFGQYLAEITTAVKYGMNITHLLLNNSQLGKITKEQRAAEW